jgi:hypothetical protein
MNISHFLPTTIYSHIFNYHKPNLKNIFTPGPGTAKLLGSINLLPIFILFFVPKGFPS